VTTRPRQRRFAKADLANAKAAAYKAAYRVYAATASFAAAYVADHAYTYAYAYDDDGAGAYHNAYGAALNEGELS